MRPLLLTVVLLVLPAVAGAQPSHPALVSGPSPLTGACSANDRTLLYGGEEGLEEETALAVHPADPDRMVVAWTQDLGLGIVAAATDDGGRTWTTGVVPGLSACTGGDLDRVIHPRLSVGPDGVVYLLSTPLDGFWPDPRSAVAHLAVSRSFDGGRSWTAPTLIDAATQPAFNDLGGIAAEPDVPGAAVVIWSNPEAVADAMLLSRTTDHGATWTTIPVRGPQPAALVGKTVVAHPGGALLAFAADGPLEGFLGVRLRSQPVSAYRSTDKGRTWSAGAVVAEHAEGIFWPVAGASADGSTHVVWGTATGDGRLRLRLRTSADAGATWGEAREVTTIDREAHAAVHPAIATAPGGVIALAHHEQVGGTRSVLLTRSDDGGVTWSTTRLAGPFAVDHVEHWLVGDVGIGYHLGLALRDGVPAVAFVGSGELAEDGRTDVRLTGADPSG